MLQSLRSCPRERFRKLNPYSPRYFEYIEGSYYPFSFLRDKIIAREIRKLIPPKGRILEIGCGTGRFLSQLEADYETYGIDISEYAIGEAKKRTKSSSLMVGEIEDFPFPLLCDGIVAINVIEHLKNPRDVLMGIRRGLKRGGFLFLHLPTASNFLSRFLLRLLYKDDTHIFIPRVFELKSLLREIGFSLRQERSGALIFLPLSHSLLLNSIPAYWGVYQKTR